LKGEMEWSDKMAQKASVPEDRIVRTLQALKKNEFLAFFVPHGSEARELVLQSVREGARVGLGGSKTLRDLELPRALKEKGAHLLDHWQESLSPQELLDVLEAFRAAVNAAWRKPDAPEIGVILDSAYRCPVWNRLKGGALRSQHMLGRAADVRVTGTTARKLYDLSLQVPSIQGRGVNDHKQFLHLDVRTEIAKWCYSEAGTEVAWYDA
jgi:hypothetical protein